MRLDAAGERIGTASISLADSTVLRLPAHVAGQDVHFSIRRIVGGVPEPEPWICGSTCVRPDATIPILCLDPGRYRVSVDWMEWDDACWPVPVRATGDVDSGGTVDLQ